MKKIYLTIDDSPSIDTPAKVDFLKDNSIQAIWFCIGSNIEKYWDNAIYIIENGGIIGNHSYSHNRFSKITFDECHKEILKTEKIINKLYYEAGIERPIKAFRFPYGDKGEDNNHFTKPFTEDGLNKVKKIQQLLKEMGFVRPNIKNVSYEYYKKFGLLSDLDWYWTYDIAEWSTFQENPVFGIETLDDVIDLMEVDLPEKWAGLNYAYSDDIILMHDHPETSYIFEPIIRRLIEKGLVFEKIPLR